MWKTLLYPRFWLLTKHRKPKFLLAKLHGNIIRATPSSPIEQTKAGQLNTSNAIVFLSSRDTHTHNTHKMESVSMLTPRSQDQILTSIYVTSNDHKAKQWQKQTNYAYKSMPLDDLNTMTPCAPLYPFSMRSYRQKTFVRSCDLTQPWAKVTGLNCTWDITSDMLRSWNLGRERLLMKMQLWRQTYREWKGRGEINTFKNHPIGLSLC